MNVIARAEAHPAACAVTGFTEGPFVDTHARCRQINPHIYLHVSVARAAGLAVGLVDGSELQSVALENERLRAELDRAETELADLNAVIDAVDTLESAQFRARKKPGRPKKQEEVAA